jgi:hypothetical protein
VSSEFINLEILRKKYPGLAEQVFADNERSELEINIQTAASGAPTAVINEKYVHSPRDPVREGRRIAETVASDGGSAPVIFLGFGLGYSAEAVAEIAAPRRPLIIVEKNVCLLRRAFELRDLSGLLSRDGLAFVPGGTGEGITQVLSLFDRKTAPVVIRNPTLTGIDEQWYKAVENRIRSWSMRDDVNTATKKKFGKRWIRNLNRNMAAIRDLPGVSRFEGLAAGDDPLPVFLAAAGPGLDGMGPLLPEIYKRCIVVAVDTSLRFLLRNNNHAPRSVRTEVPLCNHAPRSGRTEVPLCIEPDFVVVVDPQFWNSCHLNRCETGRTRLIAESAVYPPVLRLPFKESYLCGSLFPLGEFIEKRVDPKGLLGAGGSVATTAWDFARTLGPREIWIAGLDLAFPGNKTHFKGALFEEKALSESTRLNPAETWLYNALRGGLPFNAPSISGGQVLTDRRLSLYAAWFENNFRNNPHIRNYSLGGAGLAITGLEPAGADALLALPERRDEIDRLLETAFSRIEADFFDAEETRQRHDRYEKAVTALHSGLDKIKAACKKGENIAVEALRRHPAADSGPGRDKTLAALDEINRFITGSEVKEIAGFLFPADVVGETEGQTRDSFRDYLTSSVRLYRSLAEAASKG